MPGESDDLLEDLKEWIPSNSLMLSPDFVGGIVLKNKSEFQFDSHRAPLRCAPEQPDKKREKAPF